ncbi:hypothetical protein GF362_00420 [Candidatus Dojkabacteria bacterium]|nr:hypothetical protein [Candidatus Dojkabacteria bacterium]
MNKTWIHFIGIAGVATGQMAVEYKNNGYLVTGSDKGFFPPISTHLKKNKITIETGFKEKHLNKDFYKIKYDGDWFKVKKAHPDIVIAQGTKGHKNAEYIHAGNKEIPVKYYPDIITEKILKDESIVIAGTYGKTTVTAMLAWIFKYSNVDISYMFGGLGLNFENGVKFKNKDTKYSIIEGDEYYVGYDKKISKFFYYNPKILVLTSIKWDHTDIFKTKQDYINNFRELVKQVPKDGLIIYNKIDNKVNEIVQDSAKCKTVGYNYKKEIGNKYDYLNSKFKIIGEFNKENAVAAGTCAEKLGIDEESIKKALISFKGIKRRLEIRYRNKNLMIIDDFGASPPKARSSILAVKKVFPDYKLHVVFEPNLGSRTYKAIEEYDKTFHKIERLYLPRFTKVSGKYLENYDLEKYLKKKNIKAQAISDDEELIEIVSGNIYEHKKSIILFLGSHGFRGMIEQMTELLEDEEIS